MDPHRLARVGDLVSVRYHRHRDGTQAEVGQVVRQTDIMSEVITTTGSVLIRTSSLEVVQPGGLDHTHGRR